MTGIWPVNIPVKQRLAPGWYTTGLEVIRWLAGRRLRYRITGTSMAPTLWPGDHVLIDAQAYANGRPLEADLVVAHHPFVPQIVVIKRVIACDRERVWLGSDNPHTGTDSRHFGPVLQTFLIGRVTASIRS